MLETIVEYLENNTDEKVNVCFFSYDIYDFDIEIGLEGCPLDEAFAIACQLVQYIGLFGPVTMGNEVVLIEDLETQVHCNNDKEMAIIIIKLRNNNK